MTTTRILGAVHMATFIAFTHVGMGMIHRFITNDLVVCLESCLGMLKFALGLINFFTLIQNGKYPAITVFNDRMPIFMIAAW